MQLRSRPALIISLSVLSALVVGCGNRSEDQSLPLDQAGFATSAPADGSTTAPQTDAAQDVRAPEAGTPTGGDPSGVPKQAEAPAVGVPARTYGWAAGRRGRACGGGDAPGTARDGHAVGDGAPRVGAPGEQLAEAGAV